MIAKKWLAAVAVAASMVSPACAFGSASGSINGVFQLTSYGGLVLFNASGVHNSPPSCQSSSAPQRWAMNTSNATGQAALTALLTAMAMHKSIYIIGTGTCSVWGDAETADYFLIID